MVATDAYPQSSPTRYGCCCLATSADEVNQRILETAAYINDTETLASQSHTDAGQSHLEG